VSFISALPTVRPLYSVTIIVITVKSSDSASLSELVTVEVIYVVSTSDSVSLVEASKLTLYLRLRDFSKLREVLRSLTQYGLLRKYVKDVVGLKDVTVCRTHTINVAGVEVVLVCEGGVIMPEYKNQRNEAMRRLRDKAYEVCLDYGM